MPENGPESSTDRSSPDEMIRSADAAMYEAKRAPDRALRFAGEDPP